MKKPLSAFLALAMILAMTAPAASAAAPSVTLTEKYTQYSMTDSNRYLDEESYWTPPVVTDLDGDGKLEAIAGAYTLTVMDAATGAIKWQAPSGKDRSTPVVKYSHAAGAMLCKFIVKDLDGDGQKEIIIGYSSGTVSVLSNQGYFKPGWPKTTRAGAPVRALAADDVDGDGKQEIIAGLGVADSISLFVFGCDGTLKPGWPQMPADGSSSYPFYYCDGLWADGIATGDLDGDGVADIVAPTDNFFINAFHGDGTPVTVSDKFQALEAELPTLGGVIPWGTVGLYEDYGEELKRGNGGWGWDLQWQSLEEKGRKGLYGPGMGASTAIFADVDGDGTREVVVSALMNDRTAYFKTYTGNRDPFTVKDGVYQTVYIFNGDHTRFNNGTYNWEVIPNNLTNSQLGGPINLNPPLEGGDMYDGVRAVPLVADVDGDGVNEIVFNSFDGKVHCYSLKDSSKELPGWPFTLPQTTGSLYEFASAPTAADLDGDGAKEVIFGSLVTNGQHSESTGVDGALYVVGGDGKLLAKTPLHKAINFDNRCMSAPVAQDVDGDGQYEILVNTRKYGLCAYDVTVAGAQKPAQKLADAREQKIIINGDKTFSLHAAGLKDAKGNYTNYVSVRELAWVLTNALDGNSGTFDVSWDSAAGAINMETGKRYSNPTGKEGNALFTGSQPYNDDPVKILVDGKEVKLNLINIGNGNTFYQLKDLAGALGFTAVWDPAAGAVAITTK